MFSLFQNFAHNAEMRESKDEILVGELVRAMARQGCPTIQFQSSADLQRVRFRTIRDPVLNSVFVTLDRKTGSGALSAALLGSKARLHVTAEVKNRMADPDDLIKMYKTDLANIFKLPMLGQTRLNHELNSVLATVSMTIDIDDYVLLGDKGAEKLVTLMTTTIDGLREKLLPYKK